ncbi:integrase core domain-containing protein [Sphingomonas qilianensis]|uniref:integrase core domain-containing protein n=1 Tax=Sphingomonas qilianensis TaxID=1736690 RepID=UPI00361B2297
MPGHRRRVALHRARQAAAERLRGVVQRTIEAWRTDYNTVRPYSSLGGMAPAAFTNRTRQGHMDTEAKLSAA